MKFIFYLPIIIIGIFCIVTTFIKPLDRIIYSKIKRWYYFISIIWFVYILQTYQNDINSLSFVPLFGISKEVWAYFILSILFIIATFLLESLIIYPRSIGEFSLGNVKVTYQDKLDIDDLNNTIDKSIDSYKKLIALENKIMCNLREYAENCFTTNETPKNMYINLFRTYYSTDKLILCDECHIDKIDEKLNGIFNEFTKNRMSKIRVQLKEKKHYIFKQGKKGFLVALVPAVFLDNDNNLIFALEDTYILREEYDIISNIVKVFDLEIYYLLQK